MDFELLYSVLVQVLTRPIFNGNNLRIFSRRISQEYIRENSPKFLMRNMLLHRLHEVDLNAIYIVCCFKFSKHHIAEFPPVTNPLPVAIYTHAVIHAPVIYPPRRGLHRPGNSEDILLRPRFHLATILKNDSANYFRQMKKSCAIFFYLAPLAPMAMPSGNPG